jgi:hypothetical protein
MFEFGKIYNVYLMNWRGGVISTDTINTTKEDGDIKLKKIRAEASKAGLDVEAIHITEEITKYSVRISDRVDEESRRSSSRKIQTIRVESRDAADFVVNNIDRFSQLGSDINYEVNIDTAIKTIKMIKIKKA